jgi:cytochrome P450
VLFRTWDQPAPTSPVSTVPDRYGRPHLLVCGYDQVKRVLTEPGTYRPDNALDAITPLPVAALRILTRNGFKLPPTLANNGTPAHPGLRALVGEALHPHKVAAARDWLDEVVAGRVDALGAELRAGHRVDLYSELAADLPLLALGQLVDLPDAEVAEVKRFSRAALELFWAPLSRTRQVELAAEVGRFHRRLREFAADAGGLAGELRRYAQRHGLPADTAAGALFFLLVAGQETTSQFLTLLLHRLAGEPEVLSGLSTAEVRAADVVEEGLRLVPPIVTWRRVAARDTVLDGVAVPAGRSVLLWLAGPPDGEFRPGQPGSRRHLAFGAGAHRCLGAALARMEAEVVVTRAAGLLRDVVIEREPWYPDNLSFRIPDAFVIRSARVAEVRPLHPGGAGAGRPGRTTWG